MNGIIKNINAGNLVDFLTDFGEFKARWVGDVPIVGVPYFVELEIQNILLFGSDIILATEEKPSISLKNEKIIIVGLLESIDTNQCITVRIGSSIILIETTGFPFPINSYLKITVDSCVLYEVKY